MTVLFLSFEIFIIYFVFFLFKTNMITAVAPAKTATAETEIPAICFFDNFLFSFFVSTEFVFTLTTSCLLSETGENTPAAFVSSYKSNGTCFRFKKLSIFVVSYFGFCLLYFEKSNTSSSL